jgi:hypothetical protein
MVISTAHPRPVAVQVAVQVGLETEGATNKPWRTIQSNTAPSLLNNYISTGRPEVSWNPSKHSRNPASQSSLMSNSGAISSRILRPRPDMFEYLDVGLYPAVRFPHVSSFRRR